MKEEQPALQESVRATIPSRNPPEERADIAVFLVSRCAYWVTGECVLVDRAQH